MQTTKKNISAGTKEYEKKDGTKVKVTWPAGTLEIESAATQEGLTPFMVATIDSQLLHHDGSTLYRSTGGDFGKLPKTPTEGKKFWHDGKILRVNWNYIPSERTSSEDKVEALLAQAKKIAKLFTAAGEPTTVEEQLLASVADKKTKEAALAAYKAEQE